MRWSGWRWFWLVSAWENASGIVNRALSQADRRSETHPSQASNWSTGPCFLHPKPSSAGYTGSIESESTVDVMVQHNR